MNHYPLLTWPHIYDQKMPTWQIFGHVHLFNGKSDVYRSSIAKCCIPTQYEVGVDLNNYRPISFHQLKERIEWRGIDKAPEDQTIGKGQGEGDLQECRYPQILFNVLWRL